ncbi:aldo/keto reductase [Kineococcus sp. SYSU DK005]|uniref:aldo/keto reductase n=1 Tax=Kineococcus sp. SYSU DK005 TaxID=3383126 RepID=UPI003D7C9C7B
MLRPSDPTWMRPLPGTGLSVSAVTLGGAPLGSMPENFGYEVAEDQAVALVRACLDSPVRTIDTANGYSAGRSEQRIGAGIAAHGGLPGDVVVVTKVDPRGGDYSGRRVRASVEESRRRLGLDRLPLVHLHDPEFHPWEVITAAGGAVEALADLRESGAVGSIGLAGGHAPTMARYLRLGVFDALLVHNRWTLVDRSAGELIEQAAAQGVGVVNAAVYGGGMLARQQDEQDQRDQHGAVRDGGARPTYGYRPAHPATVRAVARMREVCARYGTDLATAALQHSLRDRRIATTVVGISKPRRLEQVVRAAGADLPEAFWQELEELVPAREAWLDHQDAA